MKNDTCQMESTDMENKESNGKKSKHYDVDIDQLILAKRFSRNELVLRCLSLVCLVFGFALFLIQLDILWKARQSYMVELVMRDADDVYFRYPEFYDIAHNEETWCWDPDTLLLKVNTSFFVH